MYRSGGEPVSPVCLSLSLAAKTPGHALNIMMIPSSTGTVEHPESTKLLAAAARTKICDRGLCGYACVPTTSGMLRACHSHSCERRFLRTGELCSPQPPNPRSNCLSPLLQVHKQNLRMRVSWRTAPWLTPGRLQLEIPGFNCKAHLTHTPPHATLWPPSNHRGGSSPLLNSGLPLLAGH